MNDTDILILAFWILFWAVIALFAIGATSFVGLLIWCVRSVCMNDLGKSGSHINTRRHA